MKKIFFLLLTLISLFTFCTTSKHQSYFKFNKKKVPIKIIEFSPVKVFTQKNIKRAVGKSFLESDSDLIKPSYSFLGHQFYFQNRLTGTTYTDSFSYRLKEADECIFINKDSIIMMFDPLEQYGRHDSIILLGNSKGEIQKVFSVKSNLVLRDSTPEMVNNDDAVRRTPNFYGNSYHNNKLFIHFINEAKVLGRITDKGVPIIGYINLLNGDYVPINISYPDIKYEKTFFQAPDKQFISNFAHDGNLLCGFKYTPTMIKYNVKTQEKEYIQLKSNLIDTIYPATSEKDVPKGYDFDMPYPKYYSFIYDKYRNYYYRFIRYPKDFNHGNSCYSIMVADTNFNVIAEGFLPDQGTVLSITKNYLIASSGKTADGKSNKYTAYTFSFKEGTNQELIDILKAGKEKRKRAKGSLTTYVKKQGNINVKNYTATFITDEQVCGNTLDFYLNSYKKNNQHFKKYDVYLFIQTRKPDKLREMLSEKYNLPLNENPNIIIDSMFTYSKYTNYTIEDLARNIKVRKNKIVQDTTFAVDESGIIGFQEFLINSGKEQMHLKQK